jgi:hypothetical protein
MAQLPVPEHDAKQNDPVDVLTQELPEGQVVWSAGLHAAVHAPPGNSGLEADPAPTQISPGTAVQSVFALHGFPRSVLAARPWSGQAVAGTHAPRAAQQV